MTRNRLGEMHCAFDDNATTFEHKKGPLDPTVSGCSCTKGSTYERDNGELFSKTGDGDLDWTKASA